MFSQFFKSESPASEWKDYCITDTQSIFLDHLGNVWVHGSNSKHSLGLNNSNPGDLLSMAERSSRHFNFQQNPHLKNITKILASRDGFSFFEDKAGHVWAMGNSYSGQAGIGKMVTVPAEDSDYEDQVCFAMTMPTKVPDLKANDIQKMSCSNQTSFILMKDGTVLACGANHDGQLGLGHTKGCATFTPIPELKEVKDIIAMNRQTYFILKDGRRLACGNNKYGQLGLKEKSSEDFCSLPKDMFGKVRKVAYEAGNSATLFLTEENEVFMSGAGCFYKPLLPDNKEERINTQKTILKNVDDVQLGLSAIYILSQGKVFAINESAFFKGSLHENLAGEFFSLSSVPQFENIKKLCVKCNSHIVGLKDNGEVVSTIIKDNDKKLELNYSGKVKDIAVGFLYTILTLPDDSIIGFSLRGNVPGAPGQDLSLSPEKLIKKAKEQEKEMVSRPGLGR